MFWIGLILGLWFGMSVGFFMALFLRNLPDNNFGPPIDGVSDFKVSAYTSIFKDKQTIERGRKDGSIDKWNDKVAKIHSEMWSRFNQVIKERKTKRRNLIKEWFRFAELVSNQIRKYLS